jgi:SNF family Na+-dependent transporter
MPMPPGWRKLVLAAHLTVSVGWIGAVAAYIVLDVAAATGQDAQTLKTAYLAMERVARYAIVPLALASLITGIVISLGTKWGLFRHYWVVISFLLTIFATVVLLRETALISSHADIAARTTSMDELRALPSTLVHSVGGTVLLLVVLVLNIYKPRGLTRYGRRKEREQGTVILPPG